LPALIQRQPGGTLQLFIGTQRIERLPFGAEHEQPAAYRIGHIEPATAVDANLDGGTQGTHRIGFERIDLLGVEVEDDDCRLLGIRHIDTASVIGCRDTIRFLQRKAARGSSPSSLALRLFLPFRSSCEL